MKKMLVAPHAGAWIEMSRLLKQSGSLRSRPTRARGLKFHGAACRLLVRLSRPTRARGLKYADGKIFRRKRLSRPTRARGLK